MDLSDALGSKNSSCAKGCGINRRTIKWIGDGLRHN